MPQRAPESSASSTCSPDCEREGGGKGVSGAGGGGEGDGGGGGSTPELDDGGGGVAARSADHCSASTLLRTQEAKRHLRTRVPLNLGSATFLWLERLLACDVRGETRFCGEDARIEGAENSFGPEGGL